MIGVLLQITVRGMLGRRRVLVLLALAAPLIVLAVALRLSGHGNEAVALPVLQLYGLGALLPLVALIAGTAMFGTEIDDGTIVYLLAKPISRHLMVVTRLAVAIGMCVVFAAVPTLAAGLIMGGLSGGVTMAFFVAALAGAVAYCAIFVLLGIVTRRAVVAGLVYTLVWEGAVAQAVPGAQDVSVQQWSLAVGKALASSASIHSAVGNVWVALAMLLAVAIGATILAGDRLRSLSLTGDL